jgi:hypothetical protein
VVPGERRGVVPGERRGVSPTVEASLPHPPGRSRIRLALVHRAVSALANFRLYYTLRREVKQEANCAGANMIRMAILAVLSGIVAHAGKAEEFVFEAARIRVSIGDDAVWKSFVEKTTGREYCWTNTVAACSCLQLLRL